MRFSPAQIQFIRSLSERSSAARGDTLAQRANIAHMRQARFCEVVENAAGDARDAVILARKLAIWKIRLEPYFSADPGLTVDEAIDAYWEHKS